MTDANSDPFSGYRRGQEIGVSSWLEIGQNMIDQFGSVTRDPDPMHINPKWAAANGPYGGTIAFGFLTLSLLTCFLHDAMGTDPNGHESRDGYFLNYGFDRVRLISPVPQGSRLRGRFKLTGRRQVEKARNISQMHVEIEIEGADRPALVAEWLAMWVPHSADLAVAS
jgi:acyl dehydratase